MAQGASQNYGDMVGLRFISGMFEAVADPCFGELSCLRLTDERLIIFGSCSHRHVVYP